MQQRNGCAASFHSAYFDEQVTQTAHRTNQTGETVDPEEHPSQIQLKTEAIMYGTSDAVQAIESEDMLGQLLWNRQLFLRVAKSQITSMATRATHEQNAVAYWWLAMRCTV